MGGQPGPETDSEELAPVRFRRLEGETENIVERCEVEASAFESGRGEMGPKSSEENASGVFRTVVVQVPITRLRYENWRAAAVHLIS